MPSRAIRDLSNRSTLYAAWNSLNKSNPSSKGEDGITIQRFRSELHEHISEISYQLGDGNYKFKPLRPVQIPKDQFDPKKGTRELKIPVIADRVVLKALQLYFLPILERFNAPHSYAYRKKTPDHKWGTEAAAMQIVQFSKKYPFAVEADIQQYFDMVPKQRLLAALRKAIPYRTLDELIASALAIDINLRSNNEAGCHQEGDFFGSDDRGIPQGSALSPLLANFYLTPFDFVMSSSGIPVVRYADDLVAFAESECKAKQIYDLMDRSLQWLGLNLHPEKTKIRKLQSEGLECLGYRFEQGEILPGSKAMQKIHYELKEFSDLRTIGKGFKRRKNGLRFDTVISRVSLLSLKIEGKAAAFRLCRKCPQIEVVDRKVKETFLKIFQACGLHLSAMSGRNQVKLGVPRFKNLWKRKSLRRKVYALPDLSRETVVWLKSVHGRMLRWFPGIKSFLVKSRETRRR